MPTLATLRERLAECRSRDRHRLARQLRSLRDGQHDQLHRLAERIAHSAESTATRRAAAPTPGYPPDLPIVEHRRDILEAIDSHQVVVLCGETGSGKTTQLPKLCLELGRGAAGVIGVTQPRRIAARSVATRVAEELGTPLGQLVGYKVRFGDQTSADTLIKLMTDGMLLAEAQADRFLNDYDTLIIDEAHERSLNIDFLLGILKQLLPRRRDLKVVVTSATIDPRRFAEYFDDAPILEIPGRAYPVEVRYRPRSGPDAVADASDDGAPADAAASDGEIDMLQAIADAVDEARRDGPGDMLVFLPGEREIRDVADELRGRMGARAAQQAEILPLYARLSPGEQQKVFKPHPGRRIVLATNVAETSLTVPGIRYVIDPGLARVSRFSPRHHVQRLPIEPIARDSADQRKGRCGRVGPGVCFRLYSEQDYLQRDEHTPPQIQRSDLADVILRMQALKLGAVEQFPFLDPPSGRAVAAGYDTLLELNALDDRRQLTPIGREMVKLPIDPRVARIVIAGHEQRCLREILILAAALSTPDPRLRPPERAADADRAHERFHDESSDFLALLKLWDFYHEQQDKLSRNQLRKACQQNFISHLRMREWKQTHRQLLQQAGEAKFKVNLDPADPDAIHRALLAGLLRFIARRRDDGLYEGADGRTLSLHPGSGLTRKPPRWIVSAEQIETSRLFASRCARISPQWLEPMAGHLIQRSHSEPDWFPEAGRAMTFERVSLFGLPIVPRRRVPLSRFDLDHARQLFIHHALVLREMETDAPWRRHYDAMLDEAQACIDRARRPDVLGDLKRRHDFFDALLPRDVDSRPAFEAWRKQAERDDPRVLFMPRQTIFAEPDARADAAEYPDRLRVAGQPLDAEYRYAPGESADGVTLTTPLPALRQLDETHALWGVPGWRQPIVAGLIRSLPRALRRGLPPAPDLAAEFLRLHANPTAEPLTNALGRWLSQRTGETIDARDFDPARLPDHLRPRFRVIDAAGAELAVDRDLPRLQHQLRDRIRGELHRTEHPWIRSGLTDWNFGELPATVTVDRPGGRVEAWPALVDAGDTLSIQLHDTPDAARKAMRGGLRRLVILSLPGPFKHLLKQAPRLDELAVAFAPLGPRPQLEQDLLSAAADRAIFAPAAPREPEIDPLTIRTPDQFAELLDRAWDRLHASMQQAAGLAHAILTARQQAALQLDELRHDARYAYLVRDVDVQMQAMLPRWFLTLTPLGWAPRLPVYLAAIQRRADKARGGRDRRDRELAGQVEPHWRRCLTALRAAHERGLVDPALQSYRWMIEELRVSLFAQELGAIATVSPQRLDTLWQQVRIKN